ncbi:MAG: CDP-alcohol phosphatidyltransferase family protein [Thermoprotei archaeon]|nr:MAG: CDP-alcohol phosphatidyltransferase family protein [Thermoprotei archaeon]
MEGKSTDGPISRHLNRRLSRRITELILKKEIPITPNQVSLISFLTALIGSLLYIYGLDPLAGMLVQLSSVIDGVDGELARARGETSPLGAFVDSVLDRLADAVIVLGLTSSAFRTWGALAVAPGMAALLGSLMVSYVHSQGKATLGLHVSKIGRIPMYASRDVRLFTIFVGSLLYSPLATLVTLAVLTLSYVIAKTVDVYQGLRRGGLLVIDKRSGGM